MPGSETPAGAGGSSAATADRGAIDGSCAVCQSVDLHPRWSVRSEPDADGLVPTTKEFGRALGDIARCGNCGHMQLDRMPTEEELADAYARAASADYIEEETGQRVGARRILERVERYTAPARLVDLGCWVGFLVAEADARGWEAIGVEPSRFASDHARERLGVDVRTADLFAVDLPESRFRGVVLGDVIEHLTRPGDALERARTLLEPSGVLALTLPDSGSLLARAMGPRWWSVLPTHLHYFTRRSITLLLARHGFKVLELGTDPKSFTVRYYLDKTSGYSSVLARGAVGAAERLGLADRLWTPDFRDRARVLARPADGIARG